METKQPTTRSRKPAQDGDTVDVLADDVGDVPIIGLGDPGKMGGHDAIGHGVPATRRALEEVLQRSGYHAR
ncbi:stage V sporulation protein AE [Sulfobacillus thermotolerans]|uniref:stage V sporulation protein AE n=1 Tax=Sulfobacillus thermotolerans TaxID=338644 RepID=UPI003365C985